MAEVVGQLGPEEEGNDNGPSITTNTDNSRQSVRESKQKLLNIVTAPKHNVASFKALDLVEETEFKIGPQLIDIRRDSKQQE